MRALHAKLDNLFNRVCPAGTDCVEGYESHAHAESIHDNALVQLHCPSTALCLVSAGLGYPDEHLEQVSSQTYHCIVALRQLIELSFELFVDDLRPDELMFCRAALFRQCIGNIPCLRCVLTKPNKVKIKKQISDIKRTYEEY